MNLLKTILFSLAALALLYAAPVCAGDVTQSPAAQREVRETFARDFADKVLAILQDHKKSYADNRDVLRRAFSHSVDIDWIARFVLGRSWNTASDEQRQRYTSLYRKYLTETYVSNFADDPGKRIRDIKILDVGDGEDNHFTVRTRMMLANAHDLRVNYLVREQGGRYEVLDIVIENVSLIETHRAEFAALASKAGVAGVIKRLTRLVASPVAPITLSMN
ncbi:MAG: ABC transporter substrate-binding protein [Pseudomonadota bacterium]|nr:ABC transporter substrate-binding protein [Pseudomonadota bacterium]MDE3037661.1 ABC transporter substrate-binding protein [Pseudomonadota bacterium]